MACSTGSCPISSGVPSFAGRYGYPSTFEAVEAAKLAGCPSTFGGYPTVNSIAGGVPTGYPSTFGGYPSFGGFNSYNPWTAGFGGSPSTFGGYPSTFDRFGGFNSYNPWTAGFGGYPSTFGGYPSTFDRFGGFNSYNPWTAGFGGSPSTFDRFGGFNSYNPWTAGFGGDKTFGGMPSTLERFGGYPSGSEFYGRNIENMNNNLYSIASRPSSRVESYTLSNPIRVLDREGNRMVWLCFDLKGYKPEEINVTVNKAERAVVVEAAHEVKDGKEHHVIRKFYRKFVLPESLSKVDLTKVELKSCLNVEGLLSVELALPKMTADEIAKCPTTSRLINELSYGPYGSFGSGYGYPSTFGGSSYGNGSHFHGMNTTCGPCYDNVKPVTVKTA